MNSSQIISPFFHGLEPANVGVIQVPIQSSPELDDVHLYLSLKYCKFYSPEPFDRIFQHGVPLLCAVYHDIFDGVVVQLFLKTSTHVDTVKFVETARHMRPVNWWRISPEMMQRLFFESKRKPISIGNLRFETEGILQSI